MNREKVLSKINKASKLQTIHLKLFELLEMCFKTFNLIVRMMENGCKKCRRVHS